MSLEELHVAAVALTKKKCQGRMVSPSSFICRSRPNLVGPFLLQVLLDGIGNGSLAPQLKKGLIMLLAKKGDQLFLNNKRGLALLNCVLKIFTKLYQLKLTVILQEFITKQQNAFLLGRSIHPSLILTNEILHKAR